MVKFSIIAAAYNEEKYIQAFLDSVSRQTCKDYELILIDDGSTDATGAICDRYAENCAKNTVRVIHQDNTGVLMAKRHALKQVVGEYVIIADSDDLLDSTLLEEVEKEIKKSHADIYLYDAYEIKPDGSKKIIDAGLFEGGISSQQIDKKEICRKMIDNPGLHAMWRKAVKTDILNIEADYSDAAFVSHGEDLLQTIAALDAADTIYYINKPLYNYRSVNNGLSKRYNPRSYNSLAYVYEVLEQYLCKWNMSEDTLRLYQYFMSIVYDDLTRIIKSGASFNEVKRHMKFIWSSAFFQHVRKEVRVKEMSRTRKVMLFLLQKKLHYPLYVFFRVKERK